MPTPTTDFTIFDAMELINWDSFFMGDELIQNVRALRRPLTQSTQRNVERYIELQASDVVFHVDATQLIDRRPSAGDRISDVSATSYDVLFCEKQTVGNTYTIIVRKIPDDA